MTAGNRVIIALDYPSAQPALQLVGQLAPLGVAFKVGLELFCSEGPSLLEKLAAAGASRIFLDLKFHDIPNTMAGAVRSATRYGVWMMNVHASAGSPALRASAEAAAQESCRLGIPKPLVIAVTVLTSLDDSIVCGELGVGRSTQEQVQKLAELTQASGLDGVVAPAPDAPRLREACGQDFLIVSPGIRPSGADIADQARINTPAAAIAGGSSYLVVGRPVTQATDPLQACQSILQEVAAAL